MSERADLLKEAIKLIDGDRNASYGPPTQDFSRTASLLNTLFKHHLKDDFQFKSYHIAMIIQCVKLSRLMWSPDKKDNWADIAGYAGCGWECVVEEIENKNDDNRS